MSLLGYKFMVLVLLAILLGTLKPLYFLFKVTDLLTMLGAVELILLLVVRSQKTNIVHNLLVGNILIFSNIIISGIVVQAVMHVEPVYLVIVCLLTVVSSFILMVVSNVSDLDFIKLSRFIESWLALLIIIFSIVAILQISNFARLLVCLIGVVLFMTSYYHDYNLAIHKQYKSKVLPKILANIYLDVACFALVLIYLFY